MLYIILVRLIVVSLTNMVANKSYSIKCKTITSQTWDFVLTLMFVNKVTNLRKQNVVFILNVAEHKENNLCKKMFENNLTSHLKTKNSFFFQIRSNQIVFIRET